MDNYSQRNCIRHGITLLKTEGRNLMVKRYVNSEWKLKYRYGSESACYDAAIKLTKTDSRYVKL